MSVDLLLPAEADLTTNAHEERPMAIRVCNVSKLYRIYDRPQDRLKQMLLWRLGRSYGREFWALRDVSFEVRRGETVGIIGRNGSGKSTLLQIIAGTLTPTTGEVTVNGRVAALLELGSGFNPEFTGRENVYLNGTILGISREEMDKRYDEIAAFADIGDFIDQPVKLYSSGMVVRLAFAVQAQVDPDILIVDEALAVGDFAFQHKCMSQIKRLQDRGTSIMLVTHDIAAVKSHCSQAIMLEHGQIYAAGEPDPVSVTYFHRMIDSERQAHQTGSEQVHRDQISSSRAPDTSMQNEEPVSVQPITATERHGLGHVRFQGVQIADAYGEPTASFEFGDWLVLDLLIQAEQAVESCFPGVVIKDLYGNYLTGMTTWSLGQAMPPLAAGERFLVRFKIQLLFRPGSYSMIINNCINNLGTDFYDWCDNAAQFTIREGNHEQPAYGYGMFCPPMSATLGLFSI
jgi:lipopolysaccharide transport system ATP-binding protein